MAYWLKQTKAGHSMSGVQFDLGMVTHESINKQANLMTIAMPLSDSSSADIFDYMGTTREISLAGVYTAGTAAQVSAFCGSLQTFIFGQQSYCWYNSELLAGSIPVKVNSIVIDYHGGEVQKVTWSIKLIETSTTS